ncbi:ABC transporter permease [Streptomyces sp. NPDC004539]|uniref:ABC transporter permease n=1 Tax=Streptomyces sp. NPDC004539 TaxID=3154280 RepID=UPI0033B2ECD4
MLKNVVHSEWTKIRTVRSTLWMPASAAAIAAGLALLVGASRPSDPLFASFYGLTLAQLPLAAFAILTVTDEYATGTLHATLAATPNRTRLYTAKLLATALPTAAVGGLAVVAAFFLGQHAFGEGGAALGEADSIRTLIGSWLYLVLISLLAQGLAFVLRTPARTMGVVLPFLFLGSQGAGNIPKIRAVAQYLPDQAGLLITHFVGSPDDPVFPRAYGPWTGTLVLSLWTAAALLAGYLALRRGNVG